MNNNNKICFENDDVLQHNIDLAEAFSISAFARNATTKYLDEMVPMSLNKWKKLIYYFGINTSTSKLIVEWVLTKNTARPYLIINDNNKKK